MGPLLIVGIILFLIIFLIIIFAILKSRKGKIEIQLTKYNFSPGDTIQGNLLIRIKKPISMDSLNVGIVGTRKTTSYNKISKGTNPRTRYHDIFEFSQPLDGKKELFIGEFNYPFQLKVPSNIISSTGSNIADTLIKSAQILSGNTSNTYWYITANLKTSGFDITNRIRVNIG